MIQKRSPLQTTKKRHRCDQLGYIIHKAELRSVYSATANCSQDDSATDDPTEESTYEQ